MILYLDSSAIVKEYVAEPGSGEVHAAVARSEVNGTSAISRAEVAAAFRKAVRVGAVREEEARTALRSFERTWPGLVRTRVTERLLGHASDLAWSHDLRGYDAVHLASAAAWQQALRRAVTLLSFDRSLWSAARKVGMASLPADLPGLLDAWRSRRGG